MNSKQYSRVYEPNLHLKLGMKIWIQMFAELIQHRELIWRLFLRNLLATYQQSLLGYLWIMITPLVAIGTFVLLNRIGILNIGQTDVPYPLFALLGLTTWQLLSTGIVAGSNSLTSAGALISKINFPREVLIVATMAQTIFEFLIKFLFILILCGVFKYMPPPGIVYFPLAIVPIFILTIGLSLIFSLINGIFRDTANILNLMMTFLLFLTPVLYPVPADKIYYFRLNPLTALVNAPRDLLVYGHIQQPMDFLISTGISFLIFLLAWRVFHLVETKIPERL